jgi:16S rRNA (cytosine1402-N4)-methyltransferase
MNQYRHVSAMPEEVLGYLACKPGGFYADGTLGGAGHACDICRRIAPHGLFIGIDRDSDAVASARQRLQPCLAFVHLFRGNFTELPDFMAQLNVDALDGILLDLGVSQHQLQASGRGFSFQKDEPLDMRMDMRTRTRAEDLVNDLSVDQLAHLFASYGEERWARRIARTVVAVRRQEPIRTSRKLAEVVASAVPAKSARRQTIHPATRVFMALRIAVNAELDNLRTFLGFSADLLKSGGRLVILSFHSLEDRLVKQHFKSLAKGCTCPPDLPRCVCAKRPVARLLTKKVVRPSQKEVDRNPLSRSTRLRACEKL